jgi:rhodanese-related sulfurtransferase
MPEGRFGRYMEILRRLFAGPTIDEVDAPDAQRAHLEGAALIDVREPDEYEAGHAPGAELVPLGQLRPCLRELPQDREILFICRSGNRSGVATEMAGRAGLKAKNVRGGMIGWARHGLPIE